jgi:hypothetical protein
MCAILPAKSKANEYDSIKVYITRNLRYPVAGKCGLKPIRLTSICPCLFVTHYDAVWVNVVSCLLKQNLKLAYHI